MKDKVRIEMLVSMVGVHVEGSPFSHERGDLVMWDRDEAEKMIKKNMARLAGPIAASK